MFNFHYEKTVGIIRGYNKGSYDDKTDYDFVATVVWNGDVAELRAANGKIPTKKINLFRLLQTLKKEGAKKVRIERAGNHTVPLADIIAVKDNGLTVYEIDLEKVNIK